MAHLGLRRVLRGTYDKDALRRPVWHPPGLSSRIERE